MKRSIAGIAVDSGRVLVAKRKAGGAIGLRWEFPGGKVEEGENDETALRREFEEEFGVEVKPLRPLGTASFVTHSGRRTLAAWQVKLPADAILELREHSMVAWLRREELEKLDLAESDKALLHLLTNAILESE